MLGLFLGRVKGYLIAAGVAGAALVAVYLKGAAAQRDKDNFEDLEQYRATRKNIDNSGPSGGPDAARDWLRERDRKRGGNL